MSDYAEAAAGLLASHLQSDGLRASAAGSEVRTGIGSVKLRFVVDGLEPSGDRMMLRFWASIEGLEDLAGSPIMLDLIGLGDDGDQALAEGVHGLTDGVIPVLRRHQDDGYRREGLAVMPVTSSTGPGRPVAWDLILGPPAFGGEQRDKIKEALDNLALFQGIMDSITPALEDRTGHWLKLFLARTDDGSVNGDVKVDGVPIGVAPSFQAADWREAGAFVVRQFGIIRPVERPVDPSMLAAVEGAHESGH